MKITELKRPRLFVWSVTKHTWNYVIHELILFSVQYCYQCWRKNWKIDAVPNWAISFKSFMHRNLNFAIGKHLVSFLIGYDIMKISLWRSNPHYSIPNPILNADFKYKKYTYWSVCKYILLKYNNVSYTECCYFKTVTTLNKNKEHKRQYNIIAIS